MISALLAFTTFAFTVPENNGNTPPLQQGGGMMMTDDRSTARIEQTINQYLNVEEQKNIVTPGEFTEWPLELKAGQVVIADARSEAFDPAIEIVDANKNVLAGNDDRYPGDQRPLILWSAPADGSYGLRVRGFQNRAGGQAFLRMKVYDTMTLTGQPQERWFEQSTQILLRLPMEKGQVKQIDFETPDGWYMRPHLEFNISPTGLPNLALTAGLQPAIIDTVMAPVEGEYFVMAKINIGQRRKVRAFAREIRPNMLEPNGTATAPKNGPTLGVLPVKACEIVEVAASDLSLGAHLAIFEAPEVNRFSLAKPEDNPFFPKPAAKTDQQGPALLKLPARSRDPREAVFIALRDAKIWIASNGAAPESGTYSLSVKPAATPLPVQSGIGDRLRVGDTDYWAFDSRVGDVMELDFTANEFAQQIIVRDPDLIPIFHAEAAPDQKTIEWSTITSKPGRYLVAISSVGDGGGGDYTLSREVFASKEFGKGKPAQGKLTGEQPHVWRFTVQPGQPLYVHWKDSDQDYGITVRNETGASAGIPLTRVDNNNAFGILNVDKPTTFLIVLTPRKPNVDYSISLSDLPGYAGK